MKKIIPLIINFILTPLYISWINPQALALDTMPKIIAHRGASFYRPENTLIAFQYAKDLGSQWIELDCHLSIDGKVIVIHDPDISRTTLCEGFISAMTLKEIKKHDAGSWFDTQYNKARIPSLKEVLIFAKKNLINVYIELKAGGKLLSKITIKLIEELEMEKNVVIQSFDFNLLKYCYNFNSNLKYEYLVEKLNLNDIKLAKTIHCNAINISEKMLTQEDVYAIKNAGFEVNVYTVNCPKKINFLLDLHVNGIITDKPDLALIQIIRYASK